MKELESIFRTFDHNNDGNLTQLELGSLLRSLSVQPSADNLEALIEKSDSMSNGMVDFADFVDLIAPELGIEIDEEQTRSRGSGAYTEDQLRVLFRFFDKDADGFMTEADLAHSMANVGHALTDEELTGMIDEADTDGDGLISFEEFSRAILRCAAFENNAGWD
ncbi:putative calcium-binding protein CML17 [Zostera marina]|uniref:Putative calcium-binding protein CML17 n=1 Tax=Zostera marina TaxID=29655 RepID=A0A0K9PE60_ZOSMR|nr:putative calcium-binding protein CML17 [Zostera marina]